MTAAAMATAGSGGGVGRSSTQHTHTGPGQANLCGAARKGRPCVFVVVNRVRYSVLATRKCNTSGNPIRPIIIAARYRCTHNTPPSDDLSIYLYNNNILCVCVCAYYIYTHVCIMYILLCTFCAIAMITFILWHRIPVRVPPPGTRVIICTLAFNPEKKRDEGLQRNSTTGVVYYNTAVYSQFAPKSSRNVNVTYRCVV